MNGSASSERTAGAVSRGLDRTTAAINVTASDSRDARALVVRYERLAQLYTRRARWWAVLERAAIGDHAIPTVYVRAVIEARLADAGHATDWTRRADRMIEHARATETRRAAASDVAVLRGVSA